MSSSGATIQQIGGKYRVIAQLGQGGTADVSLAVARGPKGFSKLVVLKSMKPQFRVEPDFAEMFMNEAKLAARLNHPNVVQTNEVFDFDGLPVIVMEYLEGQPLSALLAQHSGVEPTTLAIELRIIADALTGLHYSHELTDFDGQPLGVVHRDISPHNIFVTYEGQVKLLDFGIAKLNRSNVETEAGVLKGKLRYMPPEQIVGDEIDRRADVYAAGVMLWEVATGKKMWGSASEANIMNAVLSGEIPAPSTAGPVDPRLEAIIVKATAVERTDRYATANELARALEEYLDTLGNEVRARDIAGLLLRHFKEARELEAKKVQDQMAVVQALSEEDYQTFLPIELGRTDSTTLTMEKSSGAKGNRSARAATLAAAVLVFAALGVVLWETSRGGEKTLPTASAADSVKLVVNASPVEAKISVDGVHIESNPGNVLRPRDPKRTSQVHVSAPGYQDRAIEVNWGESREVFVGLSPLPVTSPAPVTSSRASTSEQGKKPASSRATKAPTKVTAPSCDPPYFIDERGVKKFKPQCL